MAARQFGHCSSEAVAIGKTAPHAAHRETVRLASMPPPLGAASAGGGGGDGLRGSALELRYPCWRYFRSLMADKISGSCASGQGRFIKRFPSGAFGACLFNVVAFLPWSSGLDIAHVVLVARLM